MAAGFSPSVLRWFGSLWCGPASAFNFSILCTYELADRLLLPNVHSVPYSVRRSGSCFDHLVTVTLTGTFVDTSFFFSDLMGHTCGQGCC